MNPANLVFINSDNLPGVKKWFTFAAVMVQNTPNLSTDFVEDMLAESPVKEPKAVVADRIPNQPKNPYRLNTL